jgi:hypothetical protein
MRRHFAETLRQLRESSLQGWAQAAIAAGCWTSKTRVSDLFSGKCVPREDTLRALHALAVRVAFPQAPFCTAEELEERRIAVLREDEQARAEAEVEAAKRLLEKKDTEHLRKAAEGERRDRIRQRNRIRHRRRRLPQRPPAHARQREALAAASVTGRPAADFVLAAATSAPVPRPEGDRRHAELPAVEWTGLPDLVMRLETGRPEDVAGLVRHTGRAAAPDQTAAALVACEATGLEEIVTGLVEQAAIRPDGDAIRVMQNLTVLGRRHLAERILMSVRTSA